MAKIAKKIINVDAGSVKFEFTNGMTEVATLATLPVEIRDRLALHGLSQKLGDSYAGASEKGWTLTECANVVHDIIASLESGQFNMSGGSGASLLVDALVRLTGKSVEEIKAGLKELDDDTVAEMKKRPDVKAAIAEIQVERAKARLSTASVDASDLDALF